MGVFFSSEAVRPPPDGVLLTIQSPTNCAKPSFEEHRAKPFPLASIPDQDWFAFHASVSEAARELKGITYELIGLPFMIVFAIAWASTVHRADILRTLAFFVVSAALWFAPRVWVVTSNRRRDKAIDQACADLSVTAGVRVEYRTESAGICRAKHNLPSRGVIIAGSQPGTAGRNQDRLATQMSTPPGAGTGAERLLAGQMLQAIAPLSMPAGAAK